MLLSACIILRPPAVFVGCIEQGMPFGSAGNEKIVGLVHLDNFFCNNENSIFLHTSQAAAFNLLETCWEAVASTPYDPVINPKQFSNHSTTSSKKSVQLWIYESIPLIHRRFELVMILLSTHCLLKLPSVSQKTAVEVTSWWGKSFQHKAWLKLVASKNMRSKICKLGVFQ